MLLCWILARNSESSFFLVLSELWDSSWWGWVLVAGWFQWCAWSVGLLLYCSAIRWAQWCYTFPRAGYWIFISFCAVISYSFVFLYNHISLIFFILSFCFTAGASWYGLVCVPVWCHEGSVFCLSTVCGVRCCEGSSSCLSTDCGVWCDEGSVCGLDTGCGVCGCEGWWTCCFERSLWWSRRPKRGERWRCCMDKGLRKKNYFLGGGGGVSKICRFWPFRRMLLFQCICWCRQFCHITHLFWSKWEKEVSLMEI